MRKAIITTEVVCNAPDGIFGEWETMPLELQALFQTPSGSIPCEGDGGMGDWCADCRWGKAEILEIEYDN